MSTLTFRILMITIAIIGFSAGFEYLYLLIIK